MIEYPVAPQPAPTPAPAVAPTPPRSRGTSRGVIALYAVAGVIAVGGVAFAAGRVTAPAAAASTRGGFTRSGFTPGESFAPGAGRGFGGLGGASVRGTVQSISGSTLTLQTSTGQTVTIDLTGSTTYHSQAAASASEVKPGATVQVEVAFNGAALGRAGTGGTGTGAGTGANGGTGAAAAPSGAPRNFTASDVMLVTP